MSKLANIIEGHINEALKDNESVEVMASERMAICSRCKAKANHPILGLRCSTKQMIEHVDPYSLELIDRLKSYDYKFVIQNGTVRVKGCGCRLEAKTRTPGEECPAGKWKAQ